MAMRCEPSVAGKNVSKHTIVVDDGAFAFPSPERPHLTRNFQKPSRLTRGAFAFHVLSQKCDDAHH
jgi:hypothetical protein